jgi:hypothetical protein
MEAELHSETSANIYHITLRHTVDGNNIYGFVVWQTELFCDDNWFGLRCGTSYFNILLFIEPSKRA